MYYYISGKVVLVDQGLVVIDNNGIGYELSVSDKCAGRVLGAKEDAVRLYTYFHVKEDAEELYGFYSLEEKQIFETLIAISGVGPKAAMAILSALSPEEFTMAVMSEDAKAISSAQGIGLKTAQKIILETRDKLTKKKALVSATGESAQPTADNSALQDALLTLEALGFARSEAMRAMSFGGSDKCSAEELIKEALKRLTRQ